eukprot:1234827-Rhodomonas_salina.3
MIGDGSSGRKLNWSASSTLCAAIPSSSGQVSLFSSLRVCIDSDHAAFDPGRSITGLRHHA